MAQSYQEWQDAHIEANKAADEERRAEADKWADENAIEGGPSGPETPEQQAERVRAVRRTMIFGDTDTTAGVDATGTDVPSADNEGASVAVAEAEASDADANTDEARRQVDADARDESAEEVDEGADDQADADPFLAGRTQDGDSAADEQPAETPAEDASTLSAREKVGRIEAADSVEEVDRLAADDDRATVRQAAEKRRGELAEV